MIDVFAYSLFFVSLLVEDVELVDVLEDDGVSLEEEEPVFPASVPDFFA
ncbi:MAG TPA: hypothetical protein VL484_00205 [Vicinamibacterales bacterium]|nr:hypothetical protein [Vicinamibacterales bacterium]